MSTRMQSRPLIGLAVLATALVLGNSRPASADGSSVAPISIAHSSSSSSDQTLEFLSGTGNYIYLGAGALLPLVEDGANGRNHTWRVIDATGVAVGFAEIGKTIFKEERPDGSGNDSFPSGHVTAAFAVATMQSSFHPDQAIFWYLGATAIAASRVGLHRHYVGDVVAGAALGYGVARWELWEPHGLVLQPLIGPDQDMGLTLTTSF